MMCESNMEALRLKYYNIYIRISGAESDIENYSVIKSKRGNPTLRITRDNRSYFLHSRFNPVREAESFVEGSYDKSKNNYLIYGCGLFYHIEKLLELDDNINIYVFESNINILLNALKSRNLLHVINNPKVVLIFEDNPQKLAEKLKELLSLDNYKLIIHRPSLEAMPRELNKIKYLLEDYMMKEASIRKFNSLMDNNFYVNIKEFDLNVDVLFDKFINIPCIIVSAGPSLDKNIRILKKAKDKAIIFSVGRAVKSLINAGILPDMIMVTDSQDFVYDTQIRGLNIDVPLIALSTCDKRVLQNYKGLKFIAFQKGYTPAESYAKENNCRLVETGGSVATTALDIAIRFGCNPIVFVGQDLAYTGLRTHADSANSEKVKECKDLRMIEDIDGNKVYTSKALYSYLRWFNRRIRREKNIRFIDATEGGAKIEGTDIMTLEEVVDNVLNNTYPFKGLLDEVININD